jgi:hypothetical protein
MDAVTSLKEELTKRHITLPLAHIRDWKPFQIDALGLVTLLGADEVNQSVGTLQHRRFTEYLPLLAAFVIAGDRFVAEQPGFVLYNLDDGITSTELKGWFTRWLMSQDVNNATTVLEWQKPDKARGLEKAFAPALSCVSVMPLLVITVLVGDWYGVGNAVAIIISVLTRVYLLSKRRHARDEAAVPKEGKPNEMKRLCIIRSDGKMITCIVPKSVLLTFVNQGPVHRPKFYHCARWVCWLALGVHMCILGMCSLVTQIYTVLLLVLSTWWFTSDFFWDIGREKLKPTGDETSVFNIPFNEDWRVKQTNYAKKNAPGPNDRRLIAWARLLLNEKDEGAMFRWNLFPIKEQSSAWWADYQEAKESFKNSGSDKSSGTMSEKSSDTPPAKTSIAPQMPSTPTPSTRLLASPPVDPLASSVSSTSTQTASDGSSPGDTTTALPPQTNSSSL